MHGIVIFASTPQFYKSFFFKLISHSISFLVAHSCIAGSNNDNKKEHLKEVEVEINRLELTKQMAFLGFKKWLSARNLLRHDNVCCNLGSLQATPRQCRQTCLWIRVQELAHPANIGGIAACNQFVPTN